MKKQILSFLLGGFTFLCIGAGVATSTEILTVKPATPKYIYINEFSDYEEFKTSLTVKYKQGYILKSHSHIVTSNGYWRWTIVMEKY